MIVLFAAKSVIVAGWTLLALRFMRRRSAADRSFIAHLGLAALAALPLGSMLFPPLEVTAFGLPEPATASSAAAWIAPFALFAPAARAPAAEAPWGLAAADWLLLAHAVVALFLVALMLLSLVRLVLLTARARAVTDEHQRLARARRVVLDDEPQVLEVQRARDLVGVEPLREARAAVVPEHDAIAAVGEHL